MAKKTHMDQDSMPTTEICVSHGDSAPAAKTHTNQGDRATETASHQLVVCMEEEEESLYDDFEVVNVNINEDDQDTCADSDLPEKNPKDKLHKLINEWNSPIYAFLWQSIHVFKCAAQGCGVKVCWYTDIKDAHLIRNLQKHATACKGWSDEILQATDQAANAKEVEVKLIGRYLHDDTITMVFKRKEKGKITYSHCPHTHEETWYHVVGI